MGVLKNQLGTWFLVGQDWHFDGDMMGKKVGFFFFVCKEVEEWYQCWSKIREDVGEVRWTSENEVSWVDLINFMV